MICYDVALFPGSFTVQCNLHEPGSEATNNVFIVSTHTSRCNYIIGSELYRAYQYFQVGDTQVSEWERRQR